MLHLVNTFDQLHCSLSERLRFSSARGTRDKKWHFAVVHTADIVDSFLLLVIELPINPVATRWPFWSVLYDSIAVGWEKHGSYPRPSRSTIFGLVFQRRAQE